MKCARIFLFLFSDFLSLLHGYAVTRTNISQRSKVSIYNRKGTMSMALFDDITVMVNGLPGPMALETAKACIDRGLKLAPFAFTGPDQKASHIEISVTFVQLF